MVEFTDPIANHKKSSHCLLSSQLISLSYDTSLTMRQKMFLRTHLMMCKHCKSFAKNTQQLHQMMKQYRQKR